MAEFQYNNYVYTSIQQTLFLLDTGQDPCMGFEPRQWPSRLETVNKFMEKIETTIKEAKSTIWKVQDNMTRYYNQRRSLALVFHPGDWVFLDTSNIKTTCLSLKLSHHCLRPFIVEYQVGPLAYCLKLPYTIKKLHPMFNIVKLSTALDDPIPGWRVEPLPPPIIVDGEKEWKVEEILDSHWYQRRF